MSKAKRDLYAEVTESIVSALETAGNWQRPWTLTANGAAYPRSIDGRPYRGVNTILLWASAMDNGYTSGIWGTFKAWYQDRPSTPDEVEAALAAEADGEPLTGIGVARKNRKGEWRTTLRTVRKGEKATMVTLWKPVRRSEKQAAANPDKPRDYLLLRHFNVFSAEQIDGFDIPEPEPLPEVERDAQADAFFAAIGADVRHGGNAAAYALGGDFITMPDRGQFASAEHYYSTLAHEHGHWTGHKSRLDRDLYNRFGDARYAAEELVAELTAAFLGAHLGFHPQVREDHAAYVKSWIKVLSNDHKAIFTAASKAQKAADYLIAAASVEDAFANSYVATDAFVGARR